MRTKLRFQWVYLKINVRISYSLLFPLEMAKAILKVALR